MKHNAAKQIQAKREQEERANHEERIHWLTADAPKWACGTPVEPPARDMMLRQSRAYLAGAA